MPRAPASTFAARTRRYDVRCLDAQSPCGDVSSSCTERFACTLRGLFGFAQLDLDRRFGIAERVHLDPTLAEFLLQPAHSGRSALLSREAALGFGLALP